MLTAQAVKDFAQQSGADLVGIGDLDRFAGAPPEMDPRFIFPDAQALIGLAFRIPRGYLRGIEEGTHFYQYPSMGYANINEVYAPSVLHELACFLEDHGYEGAVFRNTGGRMTRSDVTGSCEESPDFGRRIRFSEPVAPDRPAPDVMFHFRIAAFICGLGEIGYSKVFLTKEFGPCQRLVFVLTEAELEPDPIVTGEICDKCMACVRECPAHAISATQQQGACVAGHDISWGDLDTHKCSAVYQAGTKEISPFMPEEIKGYIDKIISEEWKQDGADMIDYSKYQNVWGHLRKNYPYIAAGWESFHHPAALCGGKGCIRACLDHLDKKGVLSRKFKHPFRDRKPWAIKQAEPSGE